MEATSIWQLAREKMRPPIDSAVDFPTPSRFHMALNVVDVELNIPFYQILLGKEPDTVRDGYAKFDLNEPPLLFSLNRVAHNAKGNGDFGVQLSNTNQMSEINERINISGIKILEHDVLDDGIFRKLIVRDPEGNRWTFFVVVNARTDEE